MDKNRKISLKKSYSFRLVNKNKKKIFLNITSYELNELNARAV